jgi:O-antigen ligase
MFNFLLILIFIRPFISSLAFPYADAVYSLSLLTFLLFWILLKGLSLNQIKPIRYPLILFICSLLISVFFSYSKTASLKELQGYATCLLIFLAGVSFADREKIKIIRAIILAGFVIGLLAIYQYFFGFRHLLDYISKQGMPNQFALDYISRRRVFYPFVTPNALAGYLIMVIPLALISRQTLWLLIPMASSLFLTQSLGAFISIFLGIVVYFNLQGKSRKSPSAITLSDFRSGMGKCFILSCTIKKRRLLILLGLFTVTGIIFMIRAGTQKQHLQPLFSTLMRLAYWQETFRIIKSHPLIGIGPGNFDLPHSRYAHNSYLQLWAETGIFGLLAFIWLILSIAKSTLKSLKNGHPKTQNALLLTSCIAFLIHNLVDLTFFLPEVSFIFWALAGILFSLR